MTMTEKFKCEFCNREFVRERTLINHLCEKKRRWMNRDEKYVQIGFEAWKTYYKMAGMNKTKEKTYKDFMSTQYYLAFTRFGKHVLNTNMVNWQQFIPFVIKNNIKLDHWCRDSIYEKYVHDVCRKEDVYTAMERQIKIMEDWARDNNDDWTEFFKKIQPGLAIKLIRTGKLSPWIILNSKTVEEFLFPRMTDEQFQIIMDFINWDVWRVKMVNDKEDTAFVKDLLEKYDL